MKTENISVAILVSVIIIYAVAISTLSNQI